MLSPKLLKYYMCTIVPIIQQSLIDIGIPQSEVGTKEIVHMFLRERFCPSLEIWNDDNCSFTLSPKSVQKLNNSQFFLYKEDIQRWAIEFLGVYIPDPNEDVKSWLIFPEEKALRNEN